MGYSTILQDTPISLFARQAVGYFTGSNLLVITIFQKPDDGIDEDDDDDEDERVAKTAEPATIGHVPRHSDCVIVIVPRRRAAERDDLPPRRSGILYDIHIQYCHRPPPLTVRRADDDGDGGGRQCRRDDDDGGPHDRRPRDDVGSDVGSRASSRDRSPGGSRGGTAPGPPRRPTPLRLVIAHESGGIVVAPPPRDVRGELRRR